MPHILFHYFNNYESRSYNDNLLIHQHEEPQYQRDGKTNMKNLHTCGYTNVKNLQGGGERETSWNKYTHHCFIYDISFQSKGSSPKNSNSNFWGRCKAEAKCLIVNRTRAITLMQLVDQIIHDRLVQHASCSSKPFLNRQDFLAVLINIWWVLKHCFWILFFNTLLYG